MSDSQVTGVEFVPLATQILIHAQEHLGHERTITAVLDLVLAVRDLSVVPHAPQLMRIFATLPTSSPVVQRVANLLVEHVASLVVSNELLEQWVVALVAAVQLQAGVKEAATPTVDILRSVLGTSLHSVDRSVA